MNNEQFKKDEMDSEIREGIKEELPDENYEEIKAERQYTEEQLLRRCIGQCETFPEFKEKCNHLLANPDEAQDYWDLYVDRSGM